MNKDADRNASIGADMVTLAKSLNIPPCHIITRIKLRQGETIECGVELDQEGSFFPWGMKCGMST
eukprot:5518659-Heterocapsa_arctica.AAC.1